ncbi:MAG: transposase [Spirochaetia bacterium]|nr:transposase [Spirochaetia bacterium]
MLHPRVLTAVHIQKSLGLNPKAACRMKRRVQLLAADQMVKVKALIHDELQKEYKGFLLPPEGTDLTAIRKRKRIVHADTVVLFSASQRANKGRKNYRNRGLTASIYLQDRLGGKQIGTLVHVMGTQQGWCLLDSVSDQKANTLGPIIREALPISTAIFTDEAYTWLYRVYRNHRMVNHSLKSKDNRWRFSRQRWCRNGVHNQVAEGLNSSLKSAMAAYRYFRPEYSQLYLSEWAFFKNLKHFGLERIRRGVGGLIHPLLDTRTKTSGVVRGGRICTGLNLAARVTELKYLAPSLEIRSISDSSNQNHLSVEERRRLASENARLADSMVENDAFWIHGNSKPYQRVKERLYQREAEKLWGQLPLGEFTDLPETNIHSPTFFYRILRRWSALGLVELENLRPPGRGHQNHCYEICRVRAEKLPRILYMQTRLEYDGRSK